MRTPEDGASVHSALDQLHACVRFGCLVSIILKAQGRVAADLAELVSSVRTWNRLLLNSSSL